MGSGKRDVDTKKLQKLLETAETLQGQMTAVLEELRAVVGGDATIGEMVKIGERLFADEWHKRYGTFYLWKHVQDKPQMKRLIKALGIEELSVRIVRYIANDEAFVQQRRHPFGLFVSTINSYAHQSTDFVLTGTAPADCRHTPRCTSDVEHTRRR